MKAACIAHICAYLVLLCSCFSNSKLAPFNVRTKDLWKVLPDSPAACYDRLDTLLTRNAKEHFSSLPEKVAVIEISRQLGLGFIEGWNLVPDAFPDPKKGKNIFLSSGGRGMVPFSNLSYYFCSKDINDPQEMIRII